MRIPPFLHPNQPTDHLTCLLRNLNAGQEATVRIGHGTANWFQIGKGVHQGSVLSPAYLTHMHNLILSDLFHNYQGVGLPYIFWGGVIQSTHLAASDTEQIKQYYVF